MSTVWSRLAALRSMAPDGSLRRYRNTSESHKNRVCHPLRRSVYGSQRSSHGVHICQRATNVVMFRPSQWDLLSRNLPTRSSHRWSGKRIRRHLGPSDFVLRRNACPLCLLNPPLAISRFSSKERLCMPGCEVGQMRWLQQEPPHLRLQRVFALYGNDLDLKQSPWRGERGYLNRRACRFV
jgi:hypothetical protein